MRRRPPEVITFWHDERTDVLVAMAEVAATRGWLNLQPGLPAELAPPDDRTLGVFSGRGPSVPVCTWMPHERTRKGVEHVALGIQHGAGSRAAALLAERSHPLPGRWAVLQDSPRHGLIVAAPPDTPHADTLDWLLRSGELLSPLPLTGEWRALVYRR